MSAAKEIAEDTPYVGTDEELKEAVEMLTATLIKDRGPADAVALLQELLECEVGDDQLVDNCPATGCCGCGAWMADVRTAGESYCWACVPHLVASDYTVLPGRDR